MTDHIRENCAFEIMPDDQIRQSMREVLQKTETPIERLELTWNKNESGYILEVVFIRKISDVPECYEVEENTRSRLKIGYINSCDYNALDRLLMVARRLYFRIRSDFPLLQRSLSKYKYFTHK